MASLGSKAVLLFFLYFAKKSFSYRPYNNQARLYSENGHLFIVGAVHSNITIRTTGAGSININDHDLVHITDRAASSAAFINSFKQNILPGLLSSSSEVLDQQVMSRLRRLEVAISLSNTSRTDGNAAVTRSLRILTRRVNILTRSVRNLRILLNRDECEVGPCQNGGTCQDLFNGFNCLCTPQWEGSLCERDVDECTRLAGTTLGCQNGGTCRNLAGSYACTCPAGWFGLHCTERTYDCSVQSSSELCGHGVCLNQGGTGRGFVCLCDQGWKRNDLDGSCSVDVNECIGAHSPCSHDPPVACINNPGSFHCAPCPIGYSGNGYQCADIDECQNNNGGCSTNPMVQCINTRGSRVCGPCPPGYIGDGTTCSSAGGKCLVDNGGCHSKAQCIENPALSYVQCKCLSGYIGSGIGPNGCVPGTAGNNDTSICYNNPCKHGGTCIPLSSGTYMCQCRPEFAGPNCSIVADPCGSSPCKNGGTCEKTRIFRLEHYRCICPRGYSGSTCSQKVEGCVGKFYMANGNVTYFPNRTFSGIHACAWTLYSPNRTQVIKLTFTSMNVGIRHLSGCFANFIEVYDGESTSTPLIGKFCGNQLPPPIYSSHPFMFITAKMFYYNPHFSFNWTTVPRECGGSLNATKHGTISSPGSPGPYPDHAHCVWTLFAPYGKRIRFTFFSLDIEHHRNCTFDYLEFHNGDSEKAPLLRRFCTSTLPEPFVSSGAEAVVVFHSDSSRTGKGFQISYSLEEGLPGCGGTYTSPQGVITAPTKPGGVEYLEDLNCEWLISLPLDEKIKIDIESLTLEMNPGCNFDYLMIFDGPSRESGVVGRWCGKVKVPPFTSTSNEVLVVFESDTTYNEGGFLLKFKAVCGGLWSGPSGIIKSPYYPFSYPKERSCTYTIQQPIGFAINVSFIDFDLEDSSDCIYDSLKIYDGNDVNSPLIGTYCGTNKPGMIVSTHNFIYMVFTTDGSNHGRGFKANYTKIDINCGGILTGKVGTISSPKYPEQYPINHECTWVISVPLGYVVQLTWLSFNIEKSNKCNRDWLAVYDKNPILAYSGQIGEKYCGNVPPPAMTASSNIVSVVFHTDKTISAPGFSASYTSVDAQDLCGGNFFTVMGEIHSPNYPNGYPHKLDCKWTITVANGQQIELSSEAFSLEANANCASDYLEIRNGGYENSPLIKRYCGTKIDSNIISWANQLYLRFVSDASVSAPGFKLIWNGATMGCGGTLTSPSGSIMSPNYPQPYGRNGECFYKIVVSLGSSIQLLIVDLDLEEHSICALDYLEIFDGGNKRSKKLARLCSQNHPSSLTSTGNQMFIMFRSDSSRQGRGFHLKYVTVCNITTKGYKGSIESPGFPERDPLSRECFWKITAPKGNRINITFSHFSFGGKETTCDTAHLRFFEGVSDSSEPSHLLGEFCNKTISPTRLSSSTNVVYVYFKHDKKNLHEALFRFEWIVSGCVGVYKRQKSGILSSPGYPYAYPYDVVCEYYISVPLGSSISIEVKALELESSINCRFDSLEIYGGSDDTAPRLAKLCKMFTSGHNPVITTSGNNAFIRFITDSSYNGLGFMATYKQLPDSKCGGLFLAEEGLIHSYNYPQNYDPHVDCVYVIGVDYQHRINLTFTDFDVAATDKNCTNGYVKVYDGESEDFPLLMKICGNTLPLPILSTTNKIFIRHKSDGFATAKGFSAVYKTECGANLVTNSSGTLVFSETNTTLNWSYESECKWIIRSTKPNSKITVQFVLLDVPPSYERERNSSNIGPGINIFAGDDTDAPFYGHYSQTILPPAFTIPSSVITVVYKSTDAIQGRFTMDYTVLDSTCGGSLTGEQGIITSPNSPDSYPNNVECVWTINAAPGNKLLFAFTKFDLQDSKGCNEDYVEIRQRTGSGPLLGVYCGTTLPHRLESNATLWIKFRSSEEGSASGFIAAFSLALESQLEGISGQIASPFAPLMCYSNFIYNWRIVVKPGYFIRIAFTDFRIDNYGDDGDCFSKLMVFDGMDNSAPLLKEFCGLRVPEPFSSGSNVVYLSLVSLMSSGSRFHLNWLQTEKFSPSKTVTETGSNCTRFIQLADKENSKFTFTSPGYPYGYESDLNCEWTFQAPFGDHVQLSFSDVNLEPNVACLADSLSIFYGGVEGSGEEWTEVGKICRNSDPKFYEGTNLVKVVFKSDFYYNETGFSGKAETDCGGTLTGPNGVLSEGGFSTCQWNITVRPSKTIKVSFTKFSLNGSPPCNEGNYILLRDGGRPDSPLLGAGKYCGTSLEEINKNIPETTSNRLYIFYRNRASEGIVLKYEEKSVSCGGDIELSRSWTSETISSPNYPNIPPPHTECIWRAFAPAGESLHFEVTDRFDMTPSLGCRKEYLELRDGSSEESELIGRYCSNTPSYVTTEGNWLFVKYFTDTDDPKDGFRGTISIAKCGGSLYEMSSGSIMSPGYPQAYDSNLNCTWRLVTSEDRRFKLNITMVTGWRDLDRECTPNMDKLTVAEIMKENMSIVGPEVMSFCGGRSRLIESETNEILINFISFKQPLRSSNRYFIVQYSTKFQRCGGNINLPSGYLRSLGYPYSMMAHCVWKITVPEGRRVTLNLIDFDLDKMLNFGSPHRLSIYNGNGFSFQSVIATLAGNMPEKKVYESTGNKMLIVYTAKRSSSHRGFYANYSSLQPAICGGQINSAEKGSIFMTTKAKESYYCEWEFKYTSAPPSIPSTITFIYSGDANSYLKDESRACHYSYSFLSIDDGEKIVGMLCSETKPNQPYIVSKPNDLSIIKMMKPKLNSESNNGSFNLSWKVDNCGFNAKNIYRAEVKSPGNSTYPPNVDCVWSISFPEGSVIRIHFDKFDLETDCSHDYLNIYNGNSPRSPLMSHHCGNIVPADIITQTNHVWLHFHSDGANEKSGFKLEINQADAGCGGVLHGTSGIIQSPGYPSNYKNNIECEWEINGPLGFHIGLSFVGRFYIEDSANCQQDYLEISDKVKGQWKVLGRICGREFPKAYNSTSNIMRVFFRTNKAITGDGFKANWQVNCGGVINVDGPGYIYSPGWPNYYFNRLDCNYTLSAPTKVIKARFESFHLEEASPQGCLYDKIQIFISKYDRGHLESSGTYCETNKPPDITSVSQMLIRFTTDSWLTYTGFSLLYNIESCGSEVTEETVLTSPKIEKVVTETECVWNIKAPSDRVVLFKLSHLRLTVSTNCTLDHIEVWDTSNTSNNSSGNLLARLCGRGVIFPVLRSSGNKMMVKFKSGFFTENKGFHGIVTFQYGEKVGCGGSYYFPATKTDSDKIITNPDLNNDGLYENNMDCHWMVSSNSERSLIVNFIKMDLKPCQGNVSKIRCCDALEVYDGPSEKNELIGRYCGTLIPRSLTSSSNYLSFRFISDGVGQGGGFKISVTPHSSNCGDSVLTASEKPQFLTSPNYPENYPINTHCFWLITSSRRRVISLHFVDLDIEETSDCTGDRVEISDEFKTPWKYINGNNLTHRTVFSNNGMGEYNSKEKNTFCGKGKPFDFYPNTNRIMIRFISDSQRTAKGFKIQYNYAGCSRNYTMPYGRIKLSMVRDNCTFTITALPNKTISMYFTELSLARDYTKDECLNKLEVYDGARKLNEVCGYEIVPPIFSESNQVTMRLIVTSQMSSSFDLSYTTTNGRGCGGTFHNEVGGFTSPMYPGNYRNFSYCCWEVTVPLPGVPSFSFYEFDLGLSSTCNTDYVEMFDVMENGEKSRRSSYCGGDKPAKFIGRTQTAAVCYRTSIHNSGIGWSVRWSAVTNLEGDSSLGTSVQLG